MNGADSSRSPARRAPRSPAVWDELAAREPYFAILADPRYLRENFDAAAEAAFFGAGDDQAGQILQFIHSHAAPLFHPDTVLEYGCGVGRLLIPFARRSMRAVGVDVSPAMLEVARRHVEKAELANVELLDAASFASDTRRFDLVNCFLVLQRIHPSQGLALIRELAGHVRGGGFAVLHLPFRSRAGRLVRWSRRARAAVPALNTAANLALRKPSSIPLIESFTYDLNEVLGLLQELGFDAPLLQTTRHGDLDGVIIHAQKRHLFDGEATREAKDEPWATPVRSPGFIDVRQLIAEKSIDDLNRTAEEYFSSLREWEDHLAKPFSRVEDSPQLLIGLGVLLQGLQLVRGMTVLEFGAGTGWLSRFLTQVGCKTILLDVSPSALRIAREHFARQPVFGERPAPEFLVFDGRKIDLPDASVDRILSFDAFHHAPNPDQVLAEFKRVLRPGGIAGFAEPGPWHSTTAQSQFEMRTHGVLENDVDIHALWATAQRLGFTDIRVAAFNVPPFHLPLAEFDDLLAAGDAFARWAEHTRVYMTAVRTFFLRNAGTEDLASRRPDGLRAEIAAALADGRVAAGEPVRLRVTVRNTGQVRWLPSEEPVGGVSLGSHLYDAAGRLLAFEHHWERIPRALLPGEEVSFDVALPPLERGRFVLELDCVAAKVAWFGQIGSETRRIEVEGG